MLGDHFGNSSKVDPLDPFHLSALKKDNVGRKGSNLKCMNVFSQFILIDDAARNRRILRQSF